MNIKTKLAAVTTGALVISSSALAQAGPSVDYTTTLNAFQTQLSAFIVANGPTMALVLVGAGGIGVAFRFIRRLMRGVGG